MNNLIFVLVIIGVAVIFLMPWYSLWVFDVAQKVFFKDSSHD